MADGARAVVVNGLSRIKNPDCAKKFTTGISQYVYYKIKDGLGFKNQLNYQIYFGT